jgi:hypothetical protein
MKNVLTGLILVFTIISCNKDKVPGESNCSSEEVSYSATIEPLIQQQCLGCHDLGGGSGGYVFNGHDNVSMNASDMLDAMRGNGLQLMPENGPALNDSLIELFEIWICQGKLNN